MREHNLWYPDTSPVPPCVNWYQSKYSEHSYDPTVLATRKIHCLDRAHKSSSRDKSRSTDYSKHVHKSPGHSYDSTIHRKKKLLQKDELRQDRLEIFWATLEIFWATQEEKQRTLRRKKRSLQKEERQARLEIFWTVQDDYHVLSIDPQYPEEHDVPEMDKIPTLAHIEAVEDLISPDSSPVASHPDILVSVTEGDEVLSPEDPAPITIPPDTITQAADGDLALITRPPDVISPIVEDQRVEEVHVPSHHYAGDPYLRDIIWCDELPYQQILAPSPTRSMLWLLLICLPTPSPTMQLQMLLCPKPHPKISTIDSLLWKQRPPRRPPER